MSARHPLSRFSVAVAVAVSLATPLALSSGLSRPAAAASLTTAWNNGAFSLNPQGVVSRSDVVLGRPNTTSSQSVPLGNGSLGVAAWAGNGFTAQLNRSDTMPSRLSPGPIPAPGRL